jgi:ppGpp synthetase/RelA/SpoT-type nucleotidyltranferase
MGEISDQFKVKHSLYSDYLNELKVLIEKLLKDSDVKVHSITSRLKSEESLLSKVKKCDDKYSKLDDITDIVGIRIITLYEDEVDIVAKLIEKEFLIDTDNSVDKRASLEPDRFGYMSVHYIVSLKKSRIRLPENKRYKDLKAEIQIRSILQHSWAEIEHDLGYKSQNAIPKEIRRNFSRLSGLLEIADIEFAKIRNQLKKYEINVAKKIKDSPNDVSIDKASLLQFVDNDELAIKLRKEILSRGVKYITNEAFYNEWVFKRLQYCNIFSIGQLKAKLKDKETIMTAFINCFYEDKIDKIKAYYTTPIAIINILCLILVLESKSKEKFEEYVNKTGFVFRTPTARKQYVKKMFDTYDKALGNKI